MGQENNLVAAFQLRWSEPARASHPALVSSDGTLSYAELNLRVATLAGALRASGIGEGERIAIAMRRSSDLVLALLGALLAGACPCVLEPGLGAEENRRRFGMTRISWLLHDATHGADESLAGLPGVRRLALDALPADAAPYRDFSPRPESPGFLLFTSGSSGKPKGVLQSHAGLWLNAAGVAAHSGLTAADRLLHTMPLYHTNGVNNQLFAALLAGATVVLAERFKAADMPGLMAHHRPTIVTGVPTMYSRMLAFDFPPEALAGLRMARCGSAPITEELHRRVEDVLGVPLVVSYGLSEATCTSTMNPPGARRVGSVGTVLAGQDVYLSDSQGQRVRQADVEGEICIAGPSLMLGYLDETCAGEPRGAGGELRTGDLGRFDDAGYLAITGRIKDVIIRGGENLSPNLIESVLAKVPGVRACCVVGKADADLGEVPTAFVVRSADAIGLQLTELAMSQAVMGELSRIHQPTQYFYLETLPENSVGKVDRKSLKAMVP